jgi:hypothetical protein
VGICLGVLSIRPKTPGTVSVQHPQAINLKIYLQPLTYYSVSTRLFHFSVCPSQSDMALLYDKDCCFCNNRSGKVLEDFTSEQFVETIPLETRFY